jgi:multiple sugar transport system substrate-binding protein
MSTRQGTRLRTAGAVAVIAAIALTGCGRSETTTGTADTTAKKVANGKATGTITVWALGAEGEKMGEIASGFEKDNPGAHVKVTVIPFDAAHDKIATAIAGNQTPDVSLVGTTWLPEFAASGALDQTPTDLIDPSAFFEGSWGTTEVDGTSMGAPWYTETRQIYYRKDLAAKAGVTPAAGWSWDDLKAFTKALQTKGGAKYGISLQPGGQGSWQSMVPFAWQQGGELVNGDKFTFNTAEMQQGLDYYASFFKEKISPTQLAPGALEAGFIKGDIGSFISGPWHMGILRDQGGKAFDSKWAVAPMPTEKAGTSFTGGSDLVVFKNSKNRDTAWKFIDYLTQVPQEQKLYDLVGSLPAVQAAWNTGALSTDPLLKSFGDQLKDAKSAPAIATWEQVAAPLDDAIEKVSLGKSDSKSALADADSQANSIGFGG